MFNIFLIYTCLAFALARSKQLRLSKTPNEWKSRVIYQVLTDRFSRPDGQNTTCDLTKYCGGTYTGLINQLDYIKDLGMNAIWISPIVKNIDGAYDGYSAIDFYQLNDYFGTENELKQFVTECHNRDIWVMVDVIYNHVACVGTEFDQINPFNRADYYHEECVMDYSNQTSLEKCRLGCFPDLDQENDFVKSQLIDWTHHLIDTYGIDGFRVGAVRHVSTDFWKALVAEFPDVFFMGEVFDFNSTNLKTYTDIMHGQLSYPMYYTIKNVFSYHLSCTLLRDLYREYQSNGIDASLLGQFVDNHDNPRFLHLNPNTQALKNALAFTLLSSSIPIVYYGTEQSFNGGDLPNNREALWQSGFNKESELYTFIQTAAKARKMMAADEEQKERYCDDVFYAFSRGNVLVCITSLRTPHKDFGRQITSLPFPVGTTIKELYTGQTRTVSGSGVHVIVHNAQPQIWVPA